MNTSFDHQRQLPPPPPPFQTPPPRREEPPPPKPSGKGRVGAIAATVGFALLKLKSLVALLKLATLGKVLLSGGSMIVYIAVMAARSGLAFGVGFVVLLLIHELGHAAAIRSHGIKASWPVFIPFFGAMIALKERPPSREADAEISYGGPLWGTVASFVVISLYFLGRNPFWLGLGYTGLFLNMFNLTPVRPLDGGAIAEMFSHRAWILGGIVIIGLLVMNPFSPALLMVLMFVPRMLKRRTEDALEPLPDAVRRRWMFRYVGLLAFTGVGMYFTRTLLDHAGH